MSAVAVGLTAEELSRLVAHHVAVSLPPERIEELAREQIQQRVGSLSLEEAREALQAPSIRALRERCAKYSIPIVTLGRTEFIKIADIERVQKEHAVKLPVRGSRKAQAGSAV